ncbi:type IVB secretion system protein IcmH/DotU [Variovorax sp. dw_954]|uniref:type IVB secretion system protein IcmH/DotU n=1 Tax=Variovorax sp. dw_954 TaxID=2720078 RepID=UPI001BD5F17D|nr:type IVB secretion system protein IcmH/DotU [Variovorax sp. dw_954]
MNATARPPSLFGGDAPPAGFTPAGTLPAQDSSLLDILYDGFVMLFLIKKKQQPAQAEQFLGGIRSYLAEFERNARKLGAGAEEVHACKYAFCAVVDEFVLASPEFAIQPEWERRPLQLALFGDQIAGENFFHMLEAQRAEGAARVQTLEVFYMCLLLGFQGKYILEGPEKLAYLTARLGDEIANIKGKRTPFAPHWPLPDQIAHTLKREAPQWVVASVFSLIALVGFIGLSLHLSGTTQSTLERYQDIVRLGPRQANLTISLP